MGLYTRSAKDTAVWVNIPDPAKKIRDQGLKDLQGMENVQQSIRQENQDILQAMSNNAQLERQNRESNWKIRQGYRDTEAEARRKQQKVVLNNFEVEEVNRKNRAKDWEAIIQFTKTGAAAIKQIDANRKEDALQVWRQWHDEYGITSQDLDAVRNVSKHQWNKSKETSQIWQSLRSRGIPENLIGQMRSIDGYGSLAVATIDAQNLARSWSSVYATAASENRKYNIAGRDVDWNTAFNSGDPVLFREIMRRIDVDEMKKHGKAFPSTKIWEYSGAARIKREIQNQFLNKHNAKSVKDAQKKRHEDEYTLIDNMGNQYDGPTDSFNFATGAWMTVEHKAGPNPTRNQLNLARSETYAAIAQGIIDGRYSVEDGEQILKSQVAHKGQGGKMVQFDSVFFKETKLLEAAIKNRQSTEYGNIQAAVNAGKIEDKKQLRDFQQIVAETEKISLSTLTGLQAAAKNNPEASRYIGSIIANHNVTINDGVNLGYIRDRLSKNQRVTQKEVEALKLSPGAFSQAMNEVRAADEFLPTSDNLENIEDFAKKELEKIIPRGTQWGTQSTRIPAEEGAVDLAVTYYVEARKAQKSHGEALSYARGALTTDLQNKEGRWAATLPTKATGGVREFRGFVDAPISAKDRIVVDTPAMQAALSKDPTGIYTTAYIDYEDLAAKVQRVNRGLRADILPVSKMLANFTGNRYSPLEVEMAQIEHYNSIAEKEGLPKLQPYSEAYVNSVKTQEEKIHPLALQYLSTPGYVNQATLKQGRNPVYPTYSVERADKIIFGDNDYNSVSTETGVVHSKDAYGYHITDASLQQANNISIKYGSSVGRHQIPTGTILEGAKLAGLSPTAKFNKENQDKIFYALFKKHGVSIYDNELLSDKDRLYLEESHKMLNSEEIGDLSYNSPALLSPLAYEIKWNQGFYSQGVAA
tara:strand:- start:2003 stop:4777 length:2775 start_codon:yes stop_codon:yes gene_type:complete